ncbi:hypothetical protein ACCS93_36955 [Rhizobium ruizarguesonis]
MPTVIRSREPGFAVPVSSAASTPVTLRFEQIATNENFSFLGNLHLGRDIDISELLEAYDAVIIATGALSDKPLGTTGTPLFATGNSISVNPMQPWELFRSAISRMSFWSDAAGPYMQSLPRENYVSSERSLTPKQ